MIDPLGFIGDIHGESTLLARLLPIATARAKRLVFLGDYVDRGPDSFGVLDLLAHLAEREEGHVFLCGNHDRAMADAIEHRQLDRFLQQGGTATVAGYVPNPEPDLASQFAASVPERHRAFLRDLRDYFVDDGISASHAPVPRPEGDETFHVSGHRPHGSLEPLVSERTARIDTGAGTIPGGRLTCFLWPSRKWVQVEPATISAAR